MTEVLLGLLVTLPYTGPRVLLLAAAATVNLLVPPGACPHPIDRIRADIRSPVGDTNPDNVRAVIQCTGCMGFWTPVNAPESVIDACLELISRGAYRQGRV